jgi:Prokaryotic glutathione synthetase, ATP-grasp domain
MTLPSGPDLLAPPSGFPAALVDVVRTRLAAGKTVRRTLPGGGGLHIDRPLPFLCLYRAPADRPDLGTAELVRSQASYLIAPAVDGQRGELAALVGGLVEVLADACGACLLLELWSGASADTGRSAPPRFLICTSAADRFATTIEALAEALRSMTLPTTELGVDVVATDDASPPGLPALIPPDAAQRAGCLMIGLEVPPLYRSPAGGLYPLVLRALARDLARALMYFQHFPEEVRPRSLITRSAEDIRKFVEQENGRAVLKPLQGSGGANVFLVKPSETGNLNQIIEAVSRDGYVIAQEYLPAAKEGGTRLFLMNGRPLEVNGKYAAFRRISAKGDARSNVHAGGRMAKAQITDEMLQIAEIVRPKLLHDGMFLVGLDIVGDKLMEINVFSPGGLGDGAKLEGENFPRAVIESLERKVMYRARGKGKLTNLQLAML